MAQEETKLGGQFLNSPEGQVATNYLGQLLNGIYSSIKYNKVKDELNQWKSSYLQSLSLPDFTQQATQMEKEGLPEEANASPISIAKRNWDLQQIYGKKMLAQASAEADMQINNQLASLNQSSGFGFGDILQTGLGLVGNYLSNKKSKNGNSAEQGVSI